MQAASSGFSFKIQLMDRGELDRQHAQLDELLDTFEQLAARSDARAEAIVAAAELIVAIGTHFGYEEAQMQAAGFADFEHHLRQHLGIMTELGIMLDGLESGIDTVAAVRSAVFLRNWYERHIAVTDKVFFDWLDARP